MRTKTDLSCNDHRTEFSFGAVIVGGDMRGFRPMIEPLLLFPKDGLDVLDGGVTRFLVNYGESIVVRL